MPHPGNEPPNRELRVAAQRLPGWVQRFHSAHPGTAVSAADPVGSLLLAAPDGYSAVLSAPWPVDGRPGTGHDDVERLVSLAGQSRVFGLVLIRRAGFAVGVARGAELIASKTGTRYVQSRTAAGGWSQQRYARRRANQADALVETAAAHAVRVLGAHPCEYLACGGDNQLISALLRAPGLKFLAGRHRLSIPDVAEPRLIALRQAARDGAAVHVAVYDPRR